VCACARVFFPLFFLHILNIPEETSGEVFTSAAE